MENAESQKSPFSTRSSGPSASEIAESGVAAARLASSFVSPQFFVDSALASLLQPSTPDLPPRQGLIPRSIISHDAGIPQVGLTVSYSVDLGTETEPTHPVSVGHRRSLSDHLYPPSPASATDEGVNKHELVRKQYANGDVYHGLWLNGKPHSVGRYVWVNGNEYDGKWSHGAMHGQGTYIEKTGERYDGEWKAGKMHGPGILTLTDGSSYHGVWKNGRKDGIGVFIPALPTSKVPEVAPSPWNDLASNSSYSSSTTSTTFSSASSPSSCDTGELSFFEPTPGYRNHPSQEVYIREYRNGRLLRSSAISANDLFGVLGPLRYDKVRRNRKWLAGKTKQPQQTPRVWEQLIKGSGSYDLVFNLQLGIRWSVSAITPKRCPVELQEQDFRAETKQSFPRSGSKATPAHQSVDFKWKDYCPMVFRKLRDYFGIDTAEYMLSICGDNTLQQQGSEGKSGSVFFLTSDLKFMIKTMKKSEVKLLVELLPKYYLHMQKYPNSLLTRFCGLHRIKPRSRSKVRFVVMKNILPANMKFDEKYDLKGSTIGRTAVKPGQVLAAGKTWKDLDLQCKLLLDQYWMDKLQEQITADCELLQACRVMDYSLLLAIRFPQPIEPPGAEKEAEEAEFSAEVEKELQKVEQQLKASRTEQQRRDDLVSLARLKLVSGRAIVNIKPRDIDYLLNQPASLSTLPALYVGKDGTMRECQVFHGIIDFLQEYNMSKRLEHVTKSLVQGAEGISAVEPNFYADRFKDFLVTKVFGTRDLSTQRMKSLPAVLAHVPRLDRGFRNENLVEQLGMTVRESEEENNYSDSPEHPRRFLSKHQRSRSDTTMFETGAQQPSLRGHSGSGPKLERAMKIETLLSDLGNLQLGAQEEDMQFKARPATSADAAMGLTPDGSTLPGTSLGGMLPPFQQMSTPFAHPVPGSYPPPASSSALTPSRLGPSRRSGPDAQAANETSLSGPGEMENGKVTFMSAPAHGASELRTANFEEVRTAKLEEVRSGEEAGVVQGSQEVGLVVETREEVVLMTSTQTIPHMDTMGSVGETKGLLRRSFASREQTD